MLLKNAVALVDMLLSGEVEQQLLKKHFDRQQQQHQQQQRNGGKVLEDKPHSSQNSTSRVRASSGPPFVLDTSEWPRTVQLETEHAALFHMGDGDTCLYGIRGRSDINIEYKTRPNK